jgi:transposase
MREQKKGSLRMLVLYFQRKLSRQTMNAELYEKWFEEKVLPALTEPTIIVLDNARYHSRMVETRPSSSWAKLKISEWLQNRNIDFDRASLKCELLEISTKYPLTKEYVIENLALQYGHVVLTVPPYHCQFNPIEIVWGIAKNYYDKNIINILVRRRKCLTYGLKL